MATNEKLNKDSELDKEIGKKDESRREDVMREPKTDRPEESRHEEEGEGRATD